SSIEARRAGPRTRRAFILGAERKRELVRLVDLRRILAEQRHHRAVADGGGLAVERLGDAEASAAVRLAPSDERIGFHHALYAERLCKRVVKPGRTLKVVSSDRDVADHGATSLFRPVLAQPPRSSAPRLPNRPPGS